MLRKQTLNKFIGHLHGVIESHLTRSAYCAANDMCSTYFSVTFTKVLEAFKAGEVSADKFNEAIELLTQIDARYTKYQGLTPDVEEIPEVQMDLEETPNTPVVEAPYDEESEDDRSHIEFERDEDGKIKYYKFRILVRDKEPVVGKLSRDEANLIHRLYSYYGQSITQREVSRYFPEWSLVDFKRILRAFNITKASAPFAPHVIEEHTAQELLEMQLREKENDFLKKLEAERVKNNEKLLYKYAQENADLKAQLKDSKELIKSINVDGIGKFTFSELPQQDNEYTLIIWLSDIHMGAWVSSESIYGNQYNREEVERRLSLIVQQLCGCYKDIIVCNLGDSLDGQDGMTVKRTHQLPQNMTNKEQVNNFVQVMTSFMDTLSGYCDNLHYYCVGDANHDGIMGYTANLALSAVLNAKGVHSTVFDNFIGYFKHKNTTYVLCHGKDGKDMFKNWPLTLDIKTENYINEFLDFKHISGKVVVVKGDLHQSATSYGRRFKYMSVGSLFGSSEWIQKNFGNTAPACDYTVVDNYNSMDGRVVF